MKHDVPVVHIVTDGIARQLEVAMGIKDFSKEINDIYATMGRRRVLQTTIGRYSYGFYGGHTPACFNEAVKQLSRSVALGECFSLPKEALSINTVK